MKTYLTENQDNTKKPGLLNKIGAGVAVGAFLFGVATNTAEAKGSDSLKPDNKDKINNEKKDEKKKKTPKPIKDKIKKGSEKEKKDKDKIDPKPEEKTAEDIKDIYEKHTKLHALIGGSYNSKNAVSADYEKRWFLGAEINTELSKDWNFDIGLLFKQAYSNYTKARYTSGELSIGIGTNNNPTSLEKLSRVLAKGLMGEVNLTVGFDKIYSEVLQADMLDNYFAQIGVKLGFSTEDVSVLGYLNYAPSDIGGFDGDDFKDGSYERYQFGGELIVQVAKDIADMVDIAFHCKVDGSVEEYENLLEQTNIASKFGLIFQKAIEDKENYMDIGLYLTADHLDLKKPYVHNSTNFGINVEATISVGDFLLIPTLSWDEGKEYSAGLIFAYAPKATYRKEEEVEKLPEPRKTK